MTALLIMLAMMLFVVTPLASSAKIGSGIVLCFIAVLTITGVATVTGHRGLMVFVILLAVSGIGLDWAAHLASDLWLAVADYLVRLAFVLLLATIVTTQVFRPGNVTHHRVQGAICVYLLAGLAWAYSYEILLILDPSALHLPSGNLMIPARTGLLRYFSFVTLTTLGYGDILPISPFARALATSEALFGQLYPAVMIARLVSLEIMDRRKTGKSV